MIPQDGYTQTTDKKVGTLLLTIGITLIWPGCQKYTIAFPEDLYTYVVAENLLFNPDWLNAEKPVVASQSLYLFGHVPGDG
jgi:hypothetical protein